MQPVTQNPWAGLTPKEALRLLAPLSIRWWVAGGWALDPFGLREHGDLDVAVLRPEHEALRRDLPDWDLCVAHAGELRPWSGGSVGPPENAVWARPTPGDPWHFDFKIERVEGGEWVYRRDAAVRRPIDELGVVVDGVPFLAPEVARLYKG